MRLSVVAEFVRILPVVFVLAAPLAAAAEPAQVRHVVDGDTAYFLFRGADVKVRVADLDTPEVGDKAKCEAERLAGERASAFAKQLMPVGKDVDLRPTGKREKWGRLLAAIIVDGRDYAKAVIAAGLGVPYRGGTKPQWCP